MTDLGSIVEAVKDPFGVAALVVLVLFMLALKFFEPDETKIRVLVFILLLVVFGVLVFLAFESAKPAKSEDKPPEPVSVRTHVEIDRIIVNRSCDKDEEARDAELRWQISIDAAAFGGGATIPIGTAFPLENVAADYDGDLKRVVTVRVAMTELDKGNVPGSTDSRELQLDLESLKNNLPTRFELEMWPGSQRNECDVRVSGVVSIANQ